MTSSPQEWLAFFGEDYLAMYGPHLDEERTRSEALGAVALAEARPGATVLDCPTGFGRHAIVLAAEGYDVTGIDLSPIQIAEAERRRAGAATPSFLVADYRSLPFADGSFDCVLNLFTALGYLGDEGDLDVLREMRRVLRPGGTLVVDTAHRDRIVHRFRPRDWDELPDGSLVLTESEPDWVAGTTRLRFLLVLPDGTRRDHVVVHRVYSSTELATMARAAGFATVEAFGAWDGETPVSTETRLILRCR